MPTMHWLQTRNKHNINTNGKNLFHSLFHSGIQVSDEKWTKMGQGVSNKCGSFENDIQLQLGSYSYLTTWPVIKVAFGRIEIFHHKEDFQTRGNRKCSNLKSWLSKVLNSRTSLKKGIFSSSFPGPKKSRPIQEFKDWAP